MMRFDHMIVRFGRKTALDDLTFALPPHRLTAVVGKNGAGKSTLISCVTGQVRYQGEIQFDGQILSRMTARQRARLVAVLPQSLPKAPLPVESLVAMGRNPHLPFGSRLTADDQSKIDWAIQAAGLEDLRQARLDCLSGGERQRAYLAMILAQDTPVVMLDEPTTYMDILREAEFLQFLEELKTRHGKTLLVVMHDLTKAVELADSILVLEQGRQRFFGPTAQCVDSGILEETFHVHRSSYRKNGADHILYYC